jgi:hypothetical protein
MAEKLGSRLRVLEETLDRMKFRGFPMISSGPIERDNRDQRGGGGGPSGVPHLRQCMSTTGQIFQLRTGAPQNNFLMTSLF